MRLPAGLGVLLPALLASCGDDDRPASWHYIHAAILAPSCTTSSCHTGSNAAAGLDLRGPVAGYLALTGRECPGEMGPPDPPDRGYVAPFRPEYSRLLYLLRGQEVRRQMPPDRPLPAVDIDLIERWILEGAECN